MMTKKEQEEEDGRMMGRAMAEDDVPDDVDRSVRGGGENING